MPARSLAEDYQVLRSWLKSVVHTESVLGDGMNVIDGSARIEERERGK
jgi:hypothetical protein